MKAKPKEPKDPELHINAGAFDQIMRGALQVAPVKVAHAAGPTKSDRKRRGGK